MIWKRQKREIGKAEIPLPPFPCPLSESADCGVAHAGAHQFAELFRGQTGVLGDAAHAEGVDGIVARDGQAHAPIGHDRVLAFVGDAKSQLGEYTHRNGAADAGQLGHGSDGDEVLFHFRHPGFLGLHLEPLLDGGLDVSTASSRVWPWEWQPGNDGQLTTHPASD